MRMLRNVKIRIAKYLLQTSAFNTILFYNFIEILQDHIESLNIGAVVFVMDNVPFHKLTSIRQVFEKESLQHQYSQIAD